MLESNEEQMLACAIWVTLIVLQFVFGGLRIFGVIQWHWAVVLIPLWLFLSLPFLSYVGLWFLRENL